MQRFKNILLVLNPEEDVTAALDKAISLAVQNEAQLTVFTVVEELPADTYNAITAMLPQELLEQVIKERREIVDAITADIGKHGVDVKSQIASGTAFLEVIRQVLRNKHDLLITTAEDKKGIHARLFGTTSMHLMRKCPCPVWVVKRAQTRPYARILAAVDPSIDDLERDSLNPLILQLASSLARKEGAELHIIHTWKLFGERYVRIRGMTGDEINEAKQQEKMQHKLRFDSLLGRIDVADLKPYLHLIEGDPEECIPELAAAQGIDLLVMGSVCRTGIDGFLIGNTAEEVLNQVDCSVLTLKPEGFVTPVTFV